MNLKDIEYFITLCELGSFRKAALHCKATQPTISNSIQRMEKELGTPLFRRTTRKVDLTAKGNEILMYARSILVNLNHIKEVAIKKDLNNSVINLGLPTSIANFFYTELERSLPVFRGRQIKVHEIIKDTIKTQLESGVINCILLACDEDFTLHEKIKVIDDPYILVVRADDALAKKDSVSMIDIQSREILILQNNYKFDTSLKKIIKENNLKTKRDVTFYSAEVLKQAILNKGGISIVPRTSIKPTDNLVPIPFASKDVKRTIYLIFNKNYTDTEQLRNLSQQIMKILMSNF